jgi:hypothetical protein
MPQVFVEANTFLKKQLLGSTELSDSEKLYMEKGRTFHVTHYAPDRNQHLFMKLASPLPAADKVSRLEVVYAYAPHVRVDVEERNQRIQLPVKYFSQLDNDTRIFGPGWRQCNTTSNAMLADYLLKGQLTKQARERGLSEPESVYMRIVAKYGDTTDHLAQTRALKELGIDSYFSYTLSANEVLESLRAGIPVVVGFAYKSSGHICVIVGHDPVQRYWLVHDPYGTRHGASSNYDVGVGGAFDPYTYDTMQQIFWDMGGSSGWGRVVTSVQGKPTGLPLGM